MASPLDRAEPVIFRPLTEPGIEIPVGFMPYVAYFMKNQSSHGGFILPIQLDNFFILEQNRVLPSSDVAQPAPPQQPQIE